MNTEHHEKSQKNISLNRDEFDLDSFDFKPVTKGLGFHDDSKAKDSARAIRKSSKNFTAHSKPLGTSTNQGSRESQIGQSARHLQNSPMNVSHHGVLSGVEAIYSKRENPKEEEKVAKRAKSQIREASFSQMILAFALDTFIISLSISLLFFSFFTLATNTLDVFGLLHFVNRSIAFVITFFGLSFLSYFSLLESIGTFGKKLVGIKCIQIKNSKSLSIKQSFIRACISLMSFPLFFIPLIWDFQGKLSESRVVIDNES